MWGSIPGRDKGFFSAPKCQDGSGAHPASHSVSNGSIFLWLKWLGHENTTDPRLIPWLRMSMPLS